MKLEQNTERDRILDKFLSSDIESMQDIEFLEALLLFVLPIDKTRGVAQALLDHLGTLTAVFDARVEVTKRIPGVSESTATLLKLVPMIMRRYGMDQNEAEGNVYDTLEKVGSYCTARYFGENDERLSVMLLDGKRKMLGFETVQVGSLSYASVNYEKIAELLFAYDATCFVMVHNHPSGIMTPSEDDMVVTEWIERKFERMNKILLEHLIVYGSRYMPILKYISEHEV